MARKNIIFFVLICESTVVLANYSSGGNGILALAPLAFFYQYINPEWFVTFPKDDQKRDAPPVKAQQSDAGNQKDDKSQTTGDQG